MSKRMLALLLVAGLLGMQASRAGAPPAAATRDASALDHVLLWTTQVDAITSALAVRLGFQVTAGGDFDDGVANRVVRFADETYVELLYFTRPANTLEGAALAAFRFAERGNGIDSFALSTPDADATRRQLSARGHSLAAPTPDTYDPDGPGPLPPVREAWTTVAFEQRPLRACDLFFIAYSITRTPVQQADFGVRSRHPNGAKRISAVWLLVDDAEAELQRIKRLGIGSVHSQVSLPAVAASGGFVQVNDDRIYVLQPAGPGSAADALQERGPHVFGLGVETDALDRAQRIVERGYRTKVLRHSGPSGDAFLAPTSDDLGFFVEFHAALPARPHRDRRAPASPVAWFEPT